MDSSSELLKVALLEQADLFLMRVAYKKSVEDLVYHLLRQQVIKQDQ